MRVLKYYSNGAEFDLLSARKKLLALQEKHPERTYMAIKNMRAIGSPKLTICQVEEVDVDFSTVDKAPPEPERPKGKMVSVYTLESYYDDLQDWRHRVLPDLQPLIDRLNRKLNP